MAYGEDGKEIEDPPRQRRVVSEEKGQEKEIDRFDEGMNYSNYFIVHISTDVFGSKSK